MNQISENALQYQNILEYLKKESSIKNPLTIDDLFQILGNKVRSRAQVRDAVRKYYENSKFLRRIREGQNYKYWYEPRTGEYQPNNSKATHIKPEVIVEKDRIIIEHPSCRVIVELKI